MVDYCMARLTRTKVMMTSNPNAMPFVTPVHWQVHHQIQAKTPVWMPEERIQCMFSL